MTISVEKITDERLLRRANSFTTQKESKMTLETAYKYGHSPIRTQKFWVELTEIPLFVASQFVRSHVGVQHFQLSKRTDRGGSDFRETCDIYGRLIRIQAINIQHALSNEYDSAEPSEDVILASLHNLMSTSHRVAEMPNEYDRYAPTDLAFIINAEALINMAHKRLCSKASKETREIFQGIKDEIERRDPALAQHLVPTCVFRNGLCPEPKCCHYCHTREGKEMHSEYLKLYDFKCE